MKNNLQAPTHPLTTPPIHQPTHPHILRRRRSLVVGILQDAEGKIMGTFNFFTFTTSMEGGRHRR